MEINEKFCPVCKNKNDRNAIICIYCGAFLAQHPSDSTATAKDGNDPMAASVVLLKPPVDDPLIPEDGIAIYAAGTSQPVYLRFDKELIFGRKADDIPDDNLLDLTKLGGYQMGLSRRHAMIRRAEDGYEIMDLSSTNGSWLNDERLVPNKPYRLASGSQLRFGRMRLLILYHPVPKSRKTE